MSLKKNTERSPAPVQSVVRALTLVDVIEAAGGTSTISDMAARTSLSVGTVHRLAQTLVNARYLRQLPDRRYCLGSRLATLGTSASALVGTRARPVLSELATELGETANLAVLSAGSAEYLAQAAGSHSMRTFTEVGHRVPLHCTGVGKALLSMLSDEDARSTLSRTGMPVKTATTITEIEPMLAELASVRALGYCLDEGEMELGVRCIAAPVSVGSMTAVSVSGPSLRVTDDFVRRATPLLLAASSRLGRLLADDQ